MAYAFSISSACTRSRAYPSGEARGSSSPYFYLSSRRGHACGVDALSERKVSVRQCTSTLHGTIRSQEFLTSTKGATAKKFKSLVCKKRTRAEENATVVEGQRAVLDLLSDSTTRNLVKHIILEENAMPDQTMNAFINLVAACSTPPKVTFATSAVLKACSDTVTPQGVIALASLPAPYQYEYESCDSKVGTRTYLVLETSDPGNTGTLIRSAIACGVEAIILMPGSCDVWSPKTVRSAMTASFKIPLLQVGSWDECKERLKHFGVRLENDFYAATMEGSTVPNEGHDRGKGANHSLPYYKVDWAGSKSVVVCVGKEGPGLSQPIRRAIRDGEVRAVHVPMAEGIESLNAAVSGSVILFETARQRREKMNE
jgi:TrmH family RNA methyltransferase